MKLIKFLIIEKAFTPKRIVKAVFLYEGIYLNIYLNDDGNLSYGYTAMQEILIKEWPKQFLITVLLFQVIIVSFLPFVYFDMGIILTIVSWLTLSIMSLIVPIQMINRLRFQVHEKIKFHYPDGSVKVYKDSWFYRGKIKHSKY